MAKARSVQQRKFNSRPVQKKRRAKRNKSRRMLEREGVVSKGDGKDVHHVDGNPGNSSRSNLRVTARSANRRKNRRGKKSGKK